MIRGTSGSDVIVGKEGKDRILGLSGTDDVLCGNEGADTIYMATQRAIARCAGTVVPQPRQARSGAFSDTPTQHFRDCHLVPPTL